MIKYPCIIRHRIIRTIAETREKLVDREVIETITPSGFISELYDMSQEELVEEYYQWQLMLDMANK